MSDSDLNCLTLLSFNQPIELTHFCYDASAEDEKIFKSSQTVRNSLNKSEKNNLIIKDGYELLVIWESDYTLDPDKTIIKCIEFLKKNKLKYDTRICKR